MPIQAVITADIVNSTSLSSIKQKKLLKVLQQILLPHKYEFYRGDSFQVFFKNANKALQVALQCRTAAISILQAEDNAMADVRISIGIAPAKSPIKSLGASSGEVFILSGRAFDVLEKNHQRLAIATLQPIAAEGLQVIADYINAIFKTMTSKQATVLFELLMGQSQQLVAKKIKKSKSTVSQHVSAGRWIETEKLLNSYNNIINLL
jgi:hypothetical protein